MLRKPIIFEILGTIVFISAKINSQNGLSRWNVIRNGSCLQKKKEEEDEKKKKKKNTGLRNKAVICWVLIDSHPLRFRSPIERSVKETCIVFHPLLDHRLLYPSFITLCLSLFINFFLFLNFFFFFFSVDKKKNIIQVQKSIK